MEFKLPKEKLEKLDEVLKKLAEKIKLDNKDYVLAMAGGCPCGGTCAGECTSCTGGCSGHFTVG